VVLVREIEASMKSKQNRVVLCFAWYDKPQWELLCKLVPDRGELDDAYEQWQQSARRAIRMIESNGYKVRRVAVDVSVLAAWCREHDRPIDGEARAEYVAQLAQQLGNSA
jgi:hypothetical protein